MHLFKYLLDCASAAKHHSFLIVANLIKSLSHFDALFEAKLITHMLLETQ